jgi:hypothetical protein
MTKSLLLVLPIATNFESFQKKWAVELYLSRQIPESTIQTTIRNNITKRIKG